MPARPKLPKSLRRFKSAFMKSLRLVVSALVLSLIFVLSDLSRHAHLTCKVFYRKDTTVRVDSHTLNAELAKTPNQLARGLGGRECIGPNQAMLFEFAR